MLEMILYGTIRRKKIIEFAITHNLPTFGICRGMQAINNFFNGSVIDSKNSKHVGKPHIIKIVNERLQEFLGKNYAS